MSKRDLVLLAIDDASDVQRTMDVGLRAAKAREADVHVVRVVPHGGLRLDDRLGRWAFARRDARREPIGAELAAMVRAAKDDGVRVQSVTLQGEPTDVIPAYAQLHDATMLVLAPDYGSSRFFRSARVVDELARHLSIPVLVVPGRPRERNEAGPRRIVTPVDFSVASAVAMRSAVDLARRDGGRVTLVHALPEVPQHMVVSGSEALDLIRRLPARLEAVAGRLRRKAAFIGMDDVDTEVATGFADTVILETSTRSDADLVVMGITHRTWLDRVLFKSTLRRVLRRATVPVLAVPVVAGAHPWPNPAPVEQVSGGLLEELAGHRVAA